MMGVQNGTFPKLWIHGVPDCRPGSEPPLQVHEYAPGTYILRQSKCVDFEAPFLYLLLGQRRGILFDTGATPDRERCPTAAVVAEIVRRWVEYERLDRFELLIGHTHHDADHIAGDAQFAGRPGVTLIPPRLASVVALFGIEHWPEGSGTLDLGGRVLEIVPAPGHEPAHVVVYDRQTGLLLTGDNLYPGRLYVRDWNAYRRSVARLVAFTEDRPVSHVVGCHIEISTSPGVDYPAGATYQPDEHPLQLGLTHLLQLHHALEAQGGQPCRQVFDEFIIVPVDAV